MKRKDDKVVIVFCGPESTAKSTVSKQVARYYNGEWVPEYARFYVEKLNRPYTYDDVNIIAQKQIAAYHRLLKSDHKIIVFDTFLIITKVWFEIVFNKVPEELIKELNKINVDLYLLCQPDIPWVPDGVRENEALRHELYDRYKREIEKYNFPYRIVSGGGEERISQTIDYINQVLTKQANYDYKSFTGRKKCHR